MRISGIITALLLVSTIACKKNRQEASMLVKMTDAPAEWAAVNVEILAVEVHVADSSWLTLNTNAGIYNLLDLQNNVTTVLADTTWVTPGHVTQMRLILGADNTIADTSGLTFDLTIPSGQNTGIKLDLNATLEAGMTTEVLLDFDAEKSVVVSGNGIYHLKPVIQVKSVTQY